MHWRARLDMLGWIQFGECDRVDPESAMITGTKASVSYYT